MRPHFLPSPVAGLALILGVDRFMSEARSITNMIGNGIACVVVGRWVGEAAPEPKDIRYIRVVVVTLGA